MAQPPAEIPFEAALDQLETIVKKLEEGELPLDESLRMFEEGVRLATERFSASRIVPIYEALYERALAR